MTEIKISERMRSRWLVHQRGELAHLADQREAWIAGFYEEIQETVNQLGHYIPKPPTHMLDIGSGLGAIDVVYIQHCGTHCTMIDGESGTGVATKHSVPFCSRAAVTEFMRDNNVRPEQYEYRSPDSTAPAKLFDLIVSFRSWCFHYPPSTYLAFVQQHAPAGAHLMVDMRKGKKDWRDVMRTAFEVVAHVDEGAKHQRIIYRVRGKHQ